MVGVFIFLLGITASFALPAEAGCYFSPSPTGQIKLKSKLFSSKFLNVFKKFSLGVGPWGSEFPFQFSFPLINWRGHLLTSNQESKLFNCFHVCRQGHQQRCFSRKCISILVTTHQGSAFHHCILLRNSIHLDNTGSDTTASSGTGINCMRLSLWKD